MPIPESPKTHKNPWMHFVKSLSLVTFLFFTLFPFKELWPVPQFSVLFQFFLILSLSFPSPSLSPSSSTSPSLSLPCPPRGQFFSLSSSSDDPEFLFLHDTHHFSPLCLPHVCVLSPFRHLCDQGSLRSHRQARILE